MDFFRPPRPLFGGVKLLLLLLLLLDFLLLPFLLAVLLAFDELRSEMLDSFRLLKINQCLAKKPGCLDLKKFSRN